jgi:hypothetical protein
MDGMQLLYIQSKAFREETVLVLLQPEHKMEPISDHSYTTYVPNEFKNILSTYVVYY